MENQWFNTFVYAKIAKDPTIISWMVAISAIATTISTFLFGCVSDRKGKRKIFIATGYILWGIFTIVFGLTQYLTNGSGTTTGSVLMVAGIAVVLAGADDNYMRLFLVMGLVVIAFGIYCLVRMEDAPQLQPSVRGTFSQQFFSIFNIKEYVKLKELVWVNLSLAVYFIAFNTYFTHLGNYMIYYLGFTADMMGYIEGIGLVLAMLAVIPSTKLINQGKMAGLCQVAVVLNCLGVGILGLFVRPENVDTNSLWNPVLLLGIFVLGLGYLLFLQSISVWGKQLYPEDARGQFEGIRIVFFVLIPMVVAPMISNPIIMRSGKFVDAYGFTEYLPTHTLLLVGAVLVMLTLIPLAFAKKEYRARCAGEKE